MKIHFEEALTRPSAALDAEWEEDKRHIQFMKKVEDTVALFNEEKINHQELIHRLIRMINFEQNGDDPISQLVSDMWRLRMALTPPFRSPGSRKTQEEPDADSVLEMITSIRAGLTQAAKQIKMH